MSQIKALDEIKNITLEGNPDHRSTSVRLLKESLPMTEELLKLAIGVSPLNPLSMAAMTAFRTISSLVTSAAPVCNLDAPSKDIEVKVKDNGDMVYRCLHSPAHEWDLSGRKIT
jgi:hypothetical protein